jgi:hypothetical protein
MPIFGEQHVMWAYQKIQAAESCPRGKTGHDYIDQFESFEVERRRLQALLESDPTVDQWRQGVGDCDYLVHQDTNK